MAPAEQVRTLLDGVRRRWARAVIPTVVARAVLGGSLVVGAGAAVARLAAPAGGLLLGLAAGTLVASIAVAWRALARLPRRPNDAQVARFIEERQAGFEDRLSSAVGLLQEHPEGPFDRLMLTDAAARALAVRPDIVVTPEALRRAWVRLGSAGAALVVAGLLAWAPAGRVLRSLRAHLLPSSVTIAVEPGDARVVAGSALRIHARIGGQNGDAGDVPALDVSAEGRTDSQPMRRAGDGFDVEVPAVKRSFSYHVALARASSPEFTVTAVFPPRVERIDVEYEFPPATGLAPRHEEDGGDLYAPAGTRVRLHVTADKPLASGALTIGDGARVDLHAAGARLDGSLTIEGDGSYRVALADTDGLTSRGDTEYFIRVMDDRPPEVRILRPSGDRQVTPLEEVPIEARADDDYGIERLELVYAVRGRQEQIVPLRGGGSAASRTGSHLLYVEDLGVRPGDFISYYARARDTGRGRSSHEARSDMYFLEVKPFDEAFVAAASVASGGRGSGSLETLIRAEKDLIGATWKLDRRQQGGRSADDIRAVARAQREIKAQTDEAAGPARGRPGAQSPADAPGGALGRAAEAMGRAAAELEGLRTAAALPHEMDALNDLLRAQAEIRRREVSRQQQAGAGGGNGRQGQDLSSLFDRELQRKQASNYETRPAAEPAGEAAARDPLEAIRALAARQNEIAERQRDLARAQLDAEELKRQLERLTREQNELRQQAEALSHARRQAGIDERLRDITDEMRSASGDLRRQDLDSARRRSERAAAGLRDLEQALRDASPEARGRALGGLQVEARQLADAQQRLADASRRRADDPASARSADATRRVAGDKDRLADRVESLGRAARSLASGSGQEATAEAARELDRDRVAARLRESAAALRSSAEAPERDTPTARSAEAQQDEQLARALDRAAKKLGEAAGATADAEARALADRLAGARNLRERLAELDRRADAIGRDTKAGEPADAPGRPGASGREGRQGAGRTSAGDPSEALQRLQQEYAEALGRSPDLVDELRRTNADLGRGLTPDAHEYTMGAPGTQAFKQDYSRWESLRRDVGLALERYEQVLSARLVARLTADRMNAGASVELPAEYRALVARYYESLARKKK